MSVISAIVPAARHPGRFDIVIDDTPVARLSIDAFERLQLSVGRSIDGLEDRIADESAQLKVYDRAVNMLAFRARSSAELTRALTLKGEDRQHVQRAIAHLLEQGFLNDVAFAQAFTRTKLLGALHSPRRVQQGLARKGVARQVSDAAIATVVAEESVDQHALVEQVARKKLRTLATLEPVVRRRRLYAFLARRGFDGQEIRRAMAAVGAALDGDVESEE